MYCRWLLELVCGKSCHCYEVREWTSENFCIVCCSIWNAILDSHLLDDVTLVCEGLCMQALKALLVLSYFCLEYILCGLTFL